MQFDTTINRWHTAPSTGRINGSNPCSEYMHLDDSACNLASLNLLSSSTTTDAFDIEGFKAAIGVVFTAQEILVGNADYPTEAIGRELPPVPAARARLRQPRRAADGLGLPYDSDEGRALAAAITALDDRPRLRHLGPTGGSDGPVRRATPTNEERMLRVLDMHREAAADIDEELVAARAARRRPAGVGRRV